MTNEQLDEIKAALKDFEAHPKGQENCSTMAFYAVEIIPMLIHRIELLDRRVDTWKNLAREYKKMRNYYADMLERFYPLEQRAKDLADRIDANTYKEKGALLPIEEA